MSDFLSFARAHGVLICDLDTSGRLCRVPTEDHPRKRNGAYRFDGERGFVFRWDADAKAIWFDRPDYKPDPAEIRRREAMVRAMHEEQLRKHDEAAMLAASMLKSCIPAFHDYLDSKGLRHYQGLVLPDGALFVPMRGLSGNLQGAQVIRWNGRGFDKRMLPGMKAKGAVFRIGPTSPAKTILCEGYATGLSIKLAAKQMRLSAAVLVCFSAGNIEHVAPQVKGAKAVFADHDESGRGEEAARNAGLPYVMSDRIGEDANDLHQRAGLFAVCGALMGC